jgi:hypothetical protein
MIAGPYPGVGGDRACQVRIDQEVLPEGLRRVDRVSRRQVANRRGAQAGRGERRASNRATR